MITRVITWLIVRRWVSWEKAVPSVDIYISWNIYQELKRIIQLGYWSCSLRFTTAIAVDSCISHVGRRCMGRARYRIEDDIIRLPGVYSKNPRNSQDITYRETSRVKFCRIPLFTVWEAWQNSWTFRMPHYDACVNSFPTNLAIVVELSDWGRTNWKHGKTGYSLPLHSR